MKNIISIIFIALLFTSCEKVVNLKYNGNPPKVIIEGNITSEPGPYFVKITKSISLSNTGSYPTLDNAAVTINDDAGNSEALTSIGGGVYQTSTLTGTAGRTYTLTVMVENQTYTAHSTMPQQVMFDSIKIDKVVSASGTEYDLIPVYTDPIEKGNNYRFVLSVNSKLVNQQFILDDELRNGSVNASRLEINDDDLKLKTADSVSVTMQCIDKNVAFYYKTLALIADSGPGGGTTPSNPRSNISNGALGLFSAHTVQGKVRIVP